MLYLLYTIVHSAKRARTRQGGFVIQINRKTAGKVDFGSGNVLVTYDLIFEF